MTPIDWSDVDTWGRPGTNVHIGTSLDDAHTVSEAAAEDDR